MANAQAQPSEIRPAPFMYFRAESRFVMVPVVRLDAAGVLHEREALSDLLIDAVNSGAAMGFLPPIAAEDANAFWRDVASDVAAGFRVVLAARVDGQLAGSAQLELSRRSNGLHRAEVQKVMVHRRFRRRGLGRALMTAVDETARELGRSTLFLDTFAHHDARKLYEAAGWVHSGDIPAFARTPDGELRATSIYFRLLSGVPRD